MITLREYVEWGLTHCDKTASAEGTPLILENCVKNKKMKQLEVYGHSVQNGTPSPEAPVEVESVGEPCIKNWFEKNNFLSRDGYNVATNYSFYKAKYIEGLKPNTKYNVVVERLNGTKPTSAKCTVLFSGSTFSVAAGEYTTIGHASNATETNGSPYTSDVNGRLTVGVATSTTQEQLDSLWENTNVYLYEDGDETTVYKIPVTVRGKNLYDAENYPMTEGCYINGTNGAVNENVGYASTRSYIPCVELRGKTITINHTGGSNPGIAYYDEDNVFISGIKNASSTNTKITSVVPDTAYYYRFCVKAEYADVAMVEYGNVPTEYEPYIEPIKTNVYLNEPLRKIGDYADVIDFKGKKVVRKIYENVIVDFDTTKYNLSPFTTSEGLYCMRLMYKGEMLQKYKMPSIYVKGNTLCNTYPVEYSSNRVDKTLSGGSSNSATFDFIDSNYNNKTEWENYLKELSNNGTPLKMIHAILTPYEEPIECELPTLPAKTSVIEINTSLLPSNIKGKYIKR